MTNEAPARWTVVWASALACLVVVAIVLLAPRTGRLVVIVSPWQTQDRALDVIVRAGGALVGGATIPWVAVSQGASVAHASELKHAGAWLVLEGSLFETCFR